MLDEGIQKHLDKLEQDLLNIKYVTKVDYDLAGYQDGMNAPIILVDYDIPFDIEVGQWFKEKSKLKKSVIQVIEGNGVKVELEEFEDNDTYFYIVSYHTNWEQKDKTEESKKEAKFKDIVKEAKENELGLDSLSYWTFVLGYDLLHDYLMKDNLGCDIAYEDSIKITKDFMRSEEYKDTSKSGYDALVDYLKNKKLLENNKKEEAKFKDKVKAIKKSLKQRDKRLSDETAQKSAEKIAGSMIKNESIRDGWKPSIDLYTRQINEIADNLGISKNEVQKEGDSIKFRYNGKVYFAEPVAMYQVNIFDDNHNQISWGVLTDRIKEEVFTDYITDKKFIYQLVGGEYAGEYTKEGLDKLNLINGNTGENLGSRKELRNQPTLKGYLGPMWNGVKDGNVVIRYETQEVYNMLSESNKIEEIASKVPGTEVEKKPVIEYEELYSGADIDNLGSDAELIYDMYEKLGIDIDEAWDDIVANDMDSGVLKIAHINGNSYFVYDDGETQAYCIGRASDNMPISVIGNIEDDTEIMKPIKRTVHESKKLQEDEIIDRPEDILEAEEDVESKSTEDVIVNKEESETVLDLLQDRIGQQIEVGRLNAILQSVFGMYNKTFILPTDLYNMDLNETQELTVFDDEDEYTIYFDIIDIDDGIIEITGVDLL